MYDPDFETFARHAREGNLIPVCREILADTETPVTALMKLADHSHVFLLESVEGGEKWARYSFLGADPRLIFRVQEEEVIIDENGAVRRIPHGGDPLRILKELLDRCRPVHLEGLPR
ncbi:MAG: anthranilate synthase component I, partial [Deltaproteobacteria bacterium]|nr:anthranilate synthase component I [Deltaproteobacteria bacterium]